MKDLINHTKRIVKKILRTPELIHEYSTEYQSKRTWLSEGLIKDYRKNIKIYDLCYFFNELDLLELRLNMLDPYVDYFVIVECTETFSGDKKPLNFLLNKDRYKKWEHKIIYYVIDDMPYDTDELRKRSKDAQLSPTKKEIVETALKSPFVDKDRHWIREFYLKESAKNALTGLKDDDVVYICDLDEIWNPDLVIDYSKDSLFKLILIPYVYYLNNRSDENWHGWTGPIVTKYKNIKNGTINYLRNHKISYNRFVFLHKAGWHFTFQGGLSGVRRKIVESNHTFYKAEKTLPGLAEAIAKNKDYQGRNFKFWIDEKNMPRYILENKSLYADQLKKSGGKKIIVKLSGGLGNQMFQYAFGLAQALMHGAELRLDISRYTTGQEKRGFMLEAFDMPVIKAGLFERVFKRKYREVETTYSKRFNDIDNGVFIGNWQSEKYFAGISEKIREDFRLRKNPTYNTLSIGSEVESVSIHIRRGDYVSSEKARVKHGLLPLEYYEKAVKLINEKVKNPNFFIFSDDIEWAKTNLKIGGNCTYVSGQGFTEAEELVLMGKCRHNIIANSTYSWWGAWLNANPNKIVIAPKAWFQTIADTSDLIPSGWIRI